MPFDLSCFIVASRRRRNPLSESRLCASFVVISLVVLTRFAPYILPAERRREESDTPKIRFRGAALKVLLY
jgi:hypothetical protein